MESTDKKENNTNNNTENDDKNGENGGSFCVMTLEGESLGQIGMTENMTIGNFAAHDKTLQTINM